MRKVLVLVLVYAGVVLAVFGVLGPNVSLFVLGILCAIAGTVLMVTIAKVTADTTQLTTTHSNSAFKTVTGRTLFYRCPDCNVLLRKRSVEGIENAEGFTSCSECGSSFPYGDVYYKGLYDIDEVEGRCPHCDAHLRGPTNDLLGKPCPACDKPLPATAG